MMQVADFGLSKEKRQSYVSGVRDLRGTLPFIAPELVNDPDRITEKADVWSMGMLMWVSQAPAAAGLAGRALPPKGALSTCLEPPCECWCQRCLSGTGSAGHTSWVVNGPACTPAPTSTICERLWTLAFFLSFFSLSDHCSVSGIISASAACLGSRQQHQPDSRKSYAAMNVFTTLGCHQCLAKLVLTACCLECRSCSR